MYRVLVIGNGSTGFSGKDYYINNHTGSFLKRLLKQKNIGRVEYCEFLGRDYDPDTNLQNFALLKNNIAFIGIPRINPISKLLFIIKVFLQNLKVDLFHIFYPSSLGTLFALLSILFNKDYSIYLRGQIDVNTTLNRLILKKAKIILTVSSGFNEAIKDLNSNCKQIKPMIAITEADILLAKNNNIMPTKLLFVGRIERDKGIYEIIDLCTHLDTLNYKYKLDLVGGGPLFDEIRNSRINNEISKNINLVGLVSDKDELINFYENASIFIFPSYHEGFPRVLYEAMTKQLPIVTTMVGGIPAVMKDGHNCIGIRPQDSKDLIDAVISLIQKSDVRVRIGKNAMQTMQEIFLKDLVEHEVLIIKFLENA